MLREFRPADGPAFLRLLKEHFPEEETILGTDPDAFLDVVRRVFRWDFQLLLRLARVVGRPIVRIYVVDVNGQLAGMTILTFTKRAGFLSNVVVDGPFRRRGFARQLLERSHQDARSAGREFAVLDVLKTNTPARALYESTGYRPLRSMSILVREAVAAPGPDSVPANSSVRSFRRGDTKALMHLAAQQIPPEVSQILPVEKARFQSSSAVTRALKSRAEAWVVDEGNGPEAHVRATVSDVMEAANLSTPLLAGSVGTDVARSLISVAAQWTSHPTPRRIIAEVPDYDSRVVTLLQGEGFHVAYRIDTLFRPLNG